MDRTGGYGGHGWFRTETLRRAGLFPSEILQVFFALVVLLFYVLSMESSYRLFVWFLVLMERATALYEPSRSCHLLFA